MGKRFQKFCEWFNDCKYVPVGSRCGACEKKLNFFFTGFWSVNNQRYNRYLSDGVLCAKCKENAEHFIKSRKKWMSKELQAQDKWQRFDARNMDYYSVSDIKALMERYPDKKVILCAHWFDVKKESEEFLELLPCARKDFEHVCFADTVSLGNILNAVHVVIAANENIAITLGQRPQKTVKDLGKFTVCDLGCKV